MKIPVSLQIKILKIINIVLIFCIIFTGYLMFLEYQNRKPHVLTGNLEYLEETSNPENPDIGVYLKLYLEYPKYAKFGEEGHVGFLKIANNTNVIGIVLKNITGNEKAGFVVDVKDNNNNGVIDTGDLFHIYERRLNGYEIMFCVNGIRGGIRITISYRDRESGNMFEMSNTMDEYLNFTFGNTNENRKYALMSIVNQACYSGTIGESICG